MSELPVADAIPLYPQTEATLSAEVTPSLSCCWNQFPQPRKVKAATEST